MIDNNAPHPRLIRNRFWKKSTSGRLKRASRNAKTNGYKMDERRMSNHPPIKKAKITVRNRAICQRRSVDTSNTSYWIM